MKNTSGLNFENARTPEQIALMRKIAEDGVCPFCAEHFKKYNPKPILKETDYWFLTENMSPYKGTKHHFLFVYKPAHITMPSEMTSGASTNLFELIDWVLAEHKIPGGAFFMRFGETKYTGGSVAHLHAHLIVGDIEAPEYEPIRVKLG